MWMRNEKHTYSSYVHTHTYTFQKIISVNQGTYPLPGLKAVEQITKKPSAKPHIMHAQLPLYIHFTHMEYNNHYMGG